MLGYRLLLGEGGPTLVRYWENHEKLVRRRLPAHGVALRPAWTRFRQQAREAPGAVGIWHETFQVAAAESIYVGMPVRRLAKATEAVPLVVAVTGRWRAIGRAARHCGSGALGQLEALTCQTCSRTPVS